ncbi:hypothetical protein F66182_15686 [Fusarium sp. NRRL 66182]|nr:hypothetical protein F66182_15686 [Fusarium sp. NRRL 66182]
MTVRLGEATRYQVAALWDRFYGEFDTKGVYKERFLDCLADFGLIEDKTGNKADMTKAVSTAALQGLFLFNKGGMEGAIRTAKELAESIDDQQA